MERSVAAGFAAAPGIRGGLTGAPALSAAQAENGLADVPIPHAQETAKDISEPAQHGRIVGGSQEARNANH
jgi:hypothetical protein